MRIIDWCSDVCSSYLRSKFYPRRIVPPGVHAMPVLSRLSLPLALSLLLASGTVAAAPDGADIDKVNGSITAESGQVYGDLDNVNGSIRLEDGAHARDRSEEHTSELKSLMRISNAVFCLKKTINTIKIE